MARIRSIKPEFWTDETMVRLPFEARLLFIGLWNFADDQGCFADEPDRLRMQIFPGEDSIDAAELLDLLHAADRVARFETEDGRRFWRIVRFAEHQKIDKPGKARFPEEDDCKKLAIPQAVRRAVAEKYGCAPGEKREAQCFYCGVPGSITWWRLRSGRPSAWISFSLELDHFVAESTGGKATVENIVLACRNCNRRKLDLDGIAFLAKAFPLALGESSTNFASPRQSSPAEGKGEEGSGKERKGGDGVAPLLSESAATSSSLQSLWNSEAHPDLPRWRESGADRRRTEKTRLKERPLPEWRLVIQRISASAFCRGQNDRGWKATPDWLLKAGTAAKVLEGKYDDAPAKAAGPPRRELPPCGIHACEGENSTGLNLCQSHLDEFKADPETQRTAADDRLALLHVWIADRNARSAA